MTSIRKEIAVFVPAQTVWNAVRDYGSVHTRLAPGMVTGTTLEDDGDVRVVTFEDGMVLTERIISVDDTARRFAYSIVGEPFEHHNASVEVIGDDERSCRLVWTADLLPHELSETVAGIMERGLRLSKQTIETAAGAATTPSGEQTATCTQHVFSPAGGPTLHHVSLFVSDLEASIAFYTAGLGLTVRRSFDDIRGCRSASDFAFGVASVFLEAGDGRYIELHPVDDGATMNPPGFPMNHLALAVTDLDNAYDRGLRAGGAVAEIPVADDRWDGTPLNVLMVGERSEPMRMAFLLGPDGELIELYQSAHT